MTDVEPLRACDPNRVGSFRLLGRIGEGGQGVVYLGANDAGERAAVKLLHARSGDNPQTGSRLVRELQAAQRVAPYATARVLETGMDGNAAYIASEFIEGPSLREVVLADGPLRDAALHRLAVGTATALAAIHRAGVVHRDFKPANVLMSADGPRVVDFGIARVTGTGTTTSEAIGTPAILAPEQIVGDEVGTKADIFAWGATIVFAATGVLPFGSDSVAQVLHRVLNDEPDLSALPEPLRDVVHSALSKAPTSRPSAHDILLRLLAVQGRANEVQGALTASVASEAVADDTDPLPYRMPTEIFARRTASAALASGIVAGIVGALVGLIVFLLSTRITVTGPASPTLALWTAGAATLATSLIVFLRGRRASAKAYARGLALLDRGRADAAVRVLQDATAALAGAERLQARANLAVALRAAGRLAEAERELSVVLPTLRQVLGDDHPDTLATRANLAAVLADDGRTDEAAAHLREIVSAAARVLGPHHPQTLTARANLAVALRAAGRLAEAERELSVVLPTLRQVLGDDHPDTLATRANLAAVLADDGRTDEAAAHLREIVSAAARVLGPHHPQTLTARANLAAALTGSEQTAAAETELSEVVRARQRTLGWAHPDTLRVSVNLGYLYLRTGQTVRAQELLDEVAETAARTLGEGHPVAVRARAGATGAQEAGR
ncbi:serine/threonine-protein kinase [Nonomuraea ceibae]|uniref:serine/threonine-protein kinase n=1 Tax=Nonomuraea ceibae TaxID=1935170 RepID=UPI001C5CF149|nr:serine/threonine-protein kinase [Nonomuraea ceibae]